MHIENRQNTDTRHSDGINSDDREQILLDDLRHEVKRLADVIEEQNALLEARHEKTVGRRDE